VSQQLYAKLTQLGIKYDAVNRIFNHRVFTKYVVVWYYFSHKRLAKQALLAHTVE